MNDALDIFGSFLMKSVRDETIDHWKRITKGQLKSEIAKNIFELLKTLDDEQLELFLQLIPEIVDTTIHYLLFGIEQNDDIEIVVEDENGARTRMSEESDGLAGELYSSDGWIAQFSNEDVFNKKKI